MHLWGCSTIGTYRLLQIEVLPNCRTHYHFGISNGVREHDLGNRMAYIFNAFGNSIRTNTNGVVSYLFGFCGKDICYRAWYELHGISKTSFYRYKEQHNAGYTRAMHGNKGIIRKGWDYVEMARVVLRDFVNNNAKRMPHKSITAIDGKRETQLVILDMDI